MKVIATLNNYQIGSYAYSCLKSKIIDEKRIDRNHTNITWDLDSTTEITRLIKVLGGKCLKTEDGLYIFTCVICNRISEGYGNSPQPVANFGFCCDACNTKIVIPTRLQRLQNCKTHDITGE